MANPIKINPANKGKFTATAKKAGKSVQAEATAVLKNPMATTLQKKRAQFAKNAAKWSKTKKSTEAEVKNSWETKPVGPKKNTPPPPMPPLFPPYKPTKKKKGK